MSIEYYLVFDNSKTSIARYFLRKQFQHVSVLIKDLDAGAWLFVNPRGGCLDVRALAYEQAENVPKLLAENGYLVVYVKPAPRKPILKRVRLWTLSCVGIAKYTLGIKLRVYTPYQLYKALIKSDKHTTRTI